MLRRATTAFQRWQDDDAAMMAAAVAYYVALSLLPTLLLLASGLGLFLKWTNLGHEAHDSLLQIVREQANPALADTLSGTLVEMEDLAVYSGPIGAATLLMAALAIFAQLDRAFDRIYRVQTVSPGGWFASGLSLLRFRLRAFAMLVGLGIAVIAIFCAGMMFNWCHERALLQLPGMHNVWWFVEAGMETALDAVLFAAVYRFVPRVPVRWRHALVGGVVAAIVWEVGRQLLGKFVIGQHYSTAYGLIGALTGVMLWGYYAISVLLGGAIFAHVMATESAEGAVPPAPLASSPRRAEAPRSPAAPGKRPKWGLARWLRLFDLAFAVCLIYVASFFVLRAVQCETRGEQQVVIFSEDPKLQTAAVNLYRPLIEIMPRDRLYPGGDQLSALNKSVAVHTVHR